MKRERRQELKTNELSVQLQRIGDYLQQKAGMLIGMGILVILALAALAYFRHNKTTEYEQGWAEFYEALLNIDREAPDWVDQVVTRYQDIIASYGDGQLKTQTRRQLIDFALDQVTRADSEDQKISLNNIATSNAEVLLREAKGDVPLKALALNALAAVEENLFALDGNPDHREAARGYLEQIRNGSEFTGTPFQAAVLERLNDFDSLWEPVVYAPSPPPPAVVPLQSDAIEGPPVLTPGKPIVIEGNIGDLGTRPSGAATPTEETSDNPAVTDDGEPDKADDSPEGEKVDAPEASQESEQEPGQKSAEPDAAEGDSQPAADPPADEGDEDPE